MKDFLKKLAVDLYERVIVSNKSTIIGWLLGAAIYAADQVLQQVAHWSSPYAPYLAMLVGLIGTALKNKAVVEAKAAAKGFGTLGLMMGIVVAGSMLMPAVARPEDPKFGGCLANGTTCFGPTVSINLVAIDLKTGVAATTFSPGIGYGATFASDKWYKWGPSLGFALRSYDAELHPQVSLVFSFAEYARVGVAGVFGAGNIADTLALLVGFGSDFGSTPAAVAVPVK